MVEIVHMDSSNNKQRILFIAPLPPPIHGSSVVSQQIKNSKLVNDAFTCDWVNLSASRSLDEVGKFKIFKIWIVLRTLCKTLFKLITHRYDLCYLAITCHGGPFLKDAPFVLLCKLFCKNIIIHQHNKGMANDVNRWPYRRIFPLCYKNTKVILLSWKLYPDIEKIVPRENVMICSNGIPDVEYDTREQHNKTPRILFLSNLLPSKGVIVLLDALKLLKDKGCLFACDFVGSESKEIDSALFDKELNARKLNTSVKYYGRKTGDTKEQFYSNADIFVLPTLNECFPLVILEAMQHGLPCVTTDEGGITDMIEDGVEGLITPKNDAISLANCIELLVNDTHLRHKLGEAGRKKIHEKFTECVFEQTLLRCLRLAQTNA